MVLASPAPALFSAAAAAPAGGPEEAAAAVEPPSAAAEAPVGAQEEESRPGQEAVAALRASDREPRLSDAVAVATSSHAHSEAQDTALLTSPAKSSEVGAGSPAGSADARAEAQGAVLLFSPGRHGQAHAAADSAVQPTAKALCQYFVMATPRTSLESPSRDRAGENADHNVPKKAGKKVGAAPAAGARSSSVQLMPCQRPSTPRSKAKGAAAAESLPSGRKTPRSSKLQMTPEHRRPSSVYSDGEGDSRSLASLSVYSDVGQQSRLTQLSRKTVTRQHLSTKEREEIEVEEKRRALREMIKRNGVNCRKALNATDLGSAGRTDRSMKVTVPKEFNLSRGVPRTPRSESVASDFESDGGELSCHQSASGRRASVQHSASASSLRKQPQLTVPKGPQLRTDRRVSLGLRRTMSCPADEESVTSDQASRSLLSARDCTPERRRKAFVEAAAMERHGAVTSRAPGGAASGAGSPLAPRTPRAGVAAPAPRTPRAGAAASSPEEASSKPLSARPLKSSKQAGSVQERADRARLEAQQKKDDEARAAKEKVCIFRKPAGQARPAKAPTKQELGNRQEQDNADMLSVGSRHSVRSSASAGCGGAGKGGARPRRPSFGSTAERPCCSTPR